MPAAAGFYYAETDLTRTPRVPVLLLHGAGSDHLCWPAEIRRMADERTLALDLPGHGRSTGSGEQTVQAYTAHVMRFLDTLGVYRAVWAGHSLGGAIALWAALHHPERVAAVGLVASSAAFKIPVKLLDYLGDKSAFPEALEILQAHLFSRNPEKTLVEKVMRAFEKAPLSRLQGDLKAAADFDVRGEISTLSLPIWAAFGTEDKLTPPAAGSYLVRQIPQASVLLARGAGHMLMLEQPKIVGDSLAAFLKLLSLNLTGS
ncbi:MAG: alpha/beta hydrolase [Anaerolineaceae bacterium]|nr:alpha/beta hydrolase [Anaerolineaceae bacterium]